MKITRSNRLVTVAGIMVAMGTLPTLATNSHLALPLIWNSMTGWLNVLGLLGIALLGYAAKGADEHSTDTEVATSSHEKNVEAVVKDSDVLSSPEKAAAEIARLRSLLKSQSQS